MTTQIKRRQFLKNSAGALALAALTPSAIAANDAKPDSIPTGKRKLRKAIMWGTVGMKGSPLEVMKAIKEAGFEGTEMMSHMNQDDVLRARDETGLIIP